MEKLIAVMQARLVSERFSKNALITIQDSKKGGFSYCIFKLFNMTDYFISASIRANCDRTA
jgi:spore coat polysaccharide biosynthesis protein SpsF (cytidylyltransferase family)